MSEPLLVPIGNAVECSVIRRINRFVVLARAPWGEEKVHINNTGRLEDVLVGGRRAYCRPLARPRRLRMRMFSVWYHGGYSVIDTGLQEEAFATAVDRGLLPWLSGCRVARRSPRVEGRRLDYELDCPSGRILVETKSAVLARGGLALYPDCPTLRGREHIALLIELSRRGLKTLLVFIAAFPGARGFMPNPEGDPAIPGLVREAMRSGVLVKSIGIEYRPDRGGVILYSPDLPVILEG
ncbi:MAG: DNA/RNA nuclease SfsA [Desulfurococcales archaeon]|nr:DNA/RNA nuclease SfsA [Desulfurococcales archaeon]